MSQPLLDQRVPTPVGPPASAYAGPLFAALERLAAVHDPATLRTAIVAEARNFVPAEAIGIGSSSDHGWRLDHIDAVDGSTQLTAALVELDQVNRLGLLDHPGVVVLPAHSLPAQNGDGPPTDCMVLADLGVGTHSRRHSLWWFGHRAAGLPAMLPLATLVGRYAGIALRSALEQDTLHEAAASRNRIGQAQGVLMALHQISPAQAFELMRQTSQRKNVKLSAVADMVVQGGRLPPTRRHRVVAT